MIFRSLKLTLLASLFFVSLANLGLCEDTEKTKEEAKTATKIEQLIEQLGSPKYTEREQAEVELLKLNIEAFLPLFSAKNHEDPEIASRARYLVRKIQANLVMPGDSAKVATLMRNIFALDYNQQSNRISKLSKLPNGEGLDALCRLIIFSESEICTKLAAMGIMKTRLYDKESSSSTLVSKEKNIFPPHEGPEIRLTPLMNDIKPLSKKSQALDDPGKPLGPKEREKIRRHLKSCDRSAAKLVLIYLDFDEVKTDAEKKALYDQWHKICLKEEKGQKYGITALTTLLSSLVKIQLEKAHELKLDDDTQIQLVRRLLVKTHFWKRINYPQITNRLIDEKVWKLADISIPEFSEVMKNSYNKNTDTLPRFFCLVIQSGKTKVGNELFDLYMGRMPFRETSKAKAYIEIATIFTQEGLVDQALAQYKIATDAENMNRNIIPERLACWEAFGRIIDIHEGLEQFELAEKTAKQMLAKLKSIPESRKRQTTFKAMLNEAQSCSAYYRAMVAKKKGHEAEYRKLLETSLNLNPKSVKVLIECYHLPATTPEGKKFHDRIVKQIETTVKYLRSSANSRVNRRKFSFQNSHVSNANLAAWLIAKTEGNLHLAITILEGTLKRYPGSSGSGVLDTLAYCYHKKGNIEKAVSFSRKSLEKAPHDKRIQISWEKFSNAYEKKTGAKPRSPKSGTERFRKLIGLS